METTFDVIAKNHIFAARKFHWDFPGSKNDGEVAQVVRAHDS
jgi:hypothetical protein